MSVTNYTIVPDRLDALLRSGEVQQTWVGRKALSYVMTVFRDAKSAAVIPSTGSLADEAYTREEVFEFVRDQNNDSLTCSYLIFAWGGMRYSHARSVADNAYKLIKIVDLIRSKKIGRDDAYEHFYALHNKREIQGLGPAFYTKILYFLGYESWSSVIMDQWTALSINYLFDQKIVKLNRFQSGNKFSYSVTKENDYRIYAKFNQCIEFLAKTLSERLDKKISNEDAEMMIFSEGRGKGKWRNHLIDNYENI